MFNTELSAYVILRDLDRARNRHIAESHALQALAARHGRRAVKASAAIPLLVRLARGWECFRGAPEARGANAPV
jgi:hypothetical protein